MTGLVEDREASALPPASRCNDRQRPEGVFSATGTTPWPTASACWISRTACITMAWTHGWISAENATLTAKPDAQGYFGFMSALRAHVEVISSNKIVSDAERRHSSTKLNPPKR